MVEPVEERCTTDPGDTLLFANDQVRVWSMTLDRNQASAFHQHLHDHLIIWPDPGRAEAQLRGEQGWTMSQTAEAGYVAFKVVGSGGPLRPHRIRNVGENPVTHLVVELIGQPSSSTTELPAVTNGRGRAVVRDTYEPY